MDLDRNEYKKFDLLSSEWWVPGGRLAALRRITPVRFEYFSDKMGDMEGRRVLDIGCGGGLLTEMFAGKGARMTGIDLSAKSIDTARHHAVESGMEIEYAVASPETFYDSVATPYDAVICSEILEHVDDLSRFINYSCGLLKRGGLFFFSTINKTLAARLLAIYAAERIINMVPRGTHRYAKFVRPSLLFHMLKKNGVKIIDIRGISFDLLRLDFKITCKTSVNYIGYGIKDMRKVNCKVE